MDDRGRQLNGNDISLRFYMISVNEQPSGLHGLFIEGMKGSAVYYPRMWGRLERS